MFWNKRSNIQKQLDTLEEELKRRMINLELDFERLKSNSISLRGLVNKKLGRSDEGNTQDLNNPVILPYDGTFK